MFNIGKVVKEVVVQPTLFIVFMPPIEEQLPYSMSN